MAMYSPQIPRFSRIPGRSDIAWLWRFWLVGNPTLCQPRGWKVLHDFFRGVPWCPHHSPSKMTGWWFQTFFMFHVIYGMSSFPLTFIFFKMAIAPPSKMTIEIHWHGIPRLAMFDWRATDLDIQFRLIHWYPKVVLFPKWLTMESMGMFIVNNNILDLVITDFSN